MKRNIRIMGLVLAVAVAVAGSASAQQKKAFRFFTYDATSANKALCFGSDAESFSACSASSDGVFDDIAMDDLTADVITATGIVTGSGLSTAGTVTAATASVSGTATAGTVAATSAATLGGVSLRTVSGLSSRVTTSVAGGSVTLTTADCGKTIISAATYTFTLPATSAGCEIAFINGGADANNLLTIDPNASDKIWGVSLSNAAAAVDLEGADGDAMSNTKATAERGDNVTLVADGVDGWYARGFFAGIWADVN